jgi:hypothetical protein
MIRLLMPLAILFAMMGAPAFGQVALQPRWDIPIEQRRAEFERTCRLMAPPAWRGEAKRAAWLASCRREAP